MDNCIIWTTYHQDGQVEAYGLAEDATHRLFATHKDVSGKNINRLNPVYSELVTLWYVWKNNLRSNFVGFNHYRRRFNVRRLPNSGECQVYRIRDFAGKTIYEQYAECHNAADMDIVLSLLDGKYGVDNQYGKYIRESSRLYSNCCFLMRWTDFTKMCRFLFPLLADFSAACGILQDNVEEWRRKAVSDFGLERAEYQMRVVSFLAERLVSAWISCHLSPYLEGRNVAVVHYNTPELLEAAIMSLQKHTPGCHVYVFDNSDSKPFHTVIPNVEVIDNTSGQVIDFDKELSAYPNKKESDISKSNYGSAKHTMSVDKLMEIIPDGFVLMDSDVLIKEDITSFWNKDVACMGAEEVKHNVPLLMPFLCWLNVPMLDGIRYFNGGKMWALSDVEPDCYYDTGAWLLEEVRRNRLPVSYVNIWRYVEHFAHGSWRGNEERVGSWLEENGKLWK